ncbi:MAG TPA: hypothetical protein VKE41_19255 [Roseiflexaceae bacterium]|nr:hypothetical protein [Roseiflexaceae bacterium]
MGLTHHHYGASLIHAPIDQLRREIHGILYTPLHATLEEAIDRTGTTYTLSYRPATGAPGIVEYVVTCTLQSVADASQATVVEWRRVYRTAAPVCQVQSFVSAQVAQDQAIATRLAAKYRGAEVMYIDYTLGGAGAL